MEIIVQLRLRQIFVKDDLGSRVALQLGPFVVPQHTYLSAIKVHNAHLWPFPQILHFEEL